MSIDYATTAYNQWQTYTYREVRRAVALYNQPANPAQVEGCQNVSQPDFQGEQSWRRPLGIALVTLFVLGGAFAAYYMVNHPIARLGAIRSGALVGSLSLVGVVVSALLIRAQRLTKGDVELLDKDHDVLSGHVDYLRAGKTGNIRIACS